MYSIQPNEFDQLKSLRQITLLVYILQGLSLFLAGVPIIAAIIINYVKRDEVQGTWLASHFNWQIRTFWFALLWSVLGGVTAFFGVGLIVLFVAWVWTIYRIVKGWLYFNDGKSLPM